MEEPIRAFIAIELPDKMKDNIAALERELKGGGIRFVTRENMHITLAFLGNIDSVKIESVKKAMNGVKGGRFFSSLKGIGTFPDQHSNVLFAKIDKNANSIIDLYGALSEQLKAASIKMDNRKYHPHATIARFLDEASKKRLKGFVEEHSELEFGEFLCSGIKLKQSVLTSEGHKYFDLFEKRLL
jgi:RNA 2',3'-cyclic 3'-phosphodiesterase